MSQQDEHVHHETSPQTTDPSTENSRTSLQQEPHDNEHSGGGTQPEQPQKRTKDIYREGIEFFCLVGVFMIGTMALYASMHGINYLKLPIDPTITFTMDFIGGERNAYSIGLEATIWAFWGVSCRLAYVALKALQNGDFRFFKYTAIWLGTFGFAWGVSIAVILSLSVISVNIGTTQITLANASLETIMAIAFIIGFFNEHAVTLLEQIRNRFTGSLEENVSK